jgi:uncharacterized coiled-coil protein SlyX
MSEERLVDLEVRYTYLERVVRDLDQVVVELRGEIERLRRQLSEVTRAAAEQASSPGNEKPPHY